jgi:hypothetical protein
MIMEGMMIVSEGEPGPVGPDASQTVRRICAACGAEVVTWIWDGTVMPTHALGGGELRPSAPRCWAGGWTVIAVEQMALMRAENGGALLRAAHP